MDKFQPKESSKDGHKKNNQPRPQTHGLQPRQMSRSMGRSMNRFESRYGSGESSSSLDKTVQAKMENAFHEDFSDVKVTKDSDEATQMGAQAFTQGNKIHFAPGNYKPHSTEGQELIGHELAHVVQQKQGRVKATTQAKGAPVNVDPALEKEADVMGKRDANINESLKDPEPKSLENACSGDVVLLPDGTTAIMLEEVEVKGTQTSSVTLYCELKSDFTSEKETIIKIVVQEGLDQSGKKAIYKAESIEEARKEAGILKTNTGKEVNGSLVEKKIKQTGASGNEEIITKLRGRDQGIGKPGVTTKGIDDASNLKSKLLKGAGNLLKESASLIDFAYLAKAFSTGNIEDAINALPLGLITQDQIAQFQEVENQVSLARLSKLIADGATPEETRDFLDQHPELNFMVIFANFSEKNKIETGQINTLTHLYDPLGYEVTESAHLVLTKSIDLSFTPLFTFK